MLISDINYIESVSQEQEIVIIGSGKDYDCKKPMWYCKKPSEPDYGTALALATSFAEALGKDATAKTITDVFADSKNGVAKSSSVGYASAS